MSLKKTKNMISFDIQSALSETANRTTRSQLAGNRPRNKWNVITMYQYLDVEGKVVGLETVFTLQYTIGKHVVEKMRNVSGEVKEEHKALLAQRIKDKLFYMPQDIDIDILTYYSRNKLKITLKTAKGLEIGHIRSTKEIVKNIIADWRQEVTR